ncbi:MAG: OmpA family protein [Bacteroidales bacterium]|nr:OmpA family protein [Bacteroidales bacterium]MCF8397617.1 OmpA family protein [Bacteroidales bacterium]
MRILIIGFITFLAYSTLSTYIYVCVIKGLCDEPVNMQISEVNKDTIIAKDTIQKQFVQQIPVPKDFIIYFKFDKYDFKPDAFTDKYFDESTQYLDQNIQAKLSITGHTDAIGNEEYNQALAYRRAQSLQHYFEKKGMPASKIIIISKGENEPADENNTVAGRANNRRTVITIKNQ